MSESQKKDAPKLLHVALFREADDLRALHKLIGLQMGDDPWQYWDAEGVPEPSAVESLLGVCGFAGKIPPAPTVRVLKEDAVNVVAIMGFTLDAADYGTVRSAIMSMARGQIGGFSPMVVALAGYHDAAIDVFAYVWSASGRPRIWVKSPPIGARAGGGSVPPSILTFAVNDISFSASHYVRSLLRATSG